MSWGNYYFWMVCTSFDKVAARWAFTSPVMRYPCARMLHCNHLNDLILHCLASKSSWLLNEISACNRPSRKQLWNALLTTEKQKKKETCQRHNLKKSSASSQSATVKVGRKHGNKEVVSLKTNTDLISLTPIVFIKRNVIWVLIRARKLSSPGGSEGDATHPEWAKHKSLPEHAPDRMQLALTMADELWTDKDQHVRGWRHVAVCPPQMEPTITVWHVH